MTCIGVDGIPPTNNCGNVLRPYTTLRFSLRLPPSFDASKAEGIMRNFVDNLKVPYGATVELLDTFAGSGFNCPVYE